MQGILNQTIWFMGLKINIREINIQTLPKIQWKKFIRFELSFKIGCNVRQWKWPDIIFSTSQLWCTFIADNHTLRFCYKVHDVVINGKQIVSEKNEQKVLQNVVKKFFLFFKSFEGFMFFWYCLIFWSIFALCCSSLKNDD